MNRFRMIPLQFYNQHLRGHQMSQRKLSKIKKNFAVKNMQTTQNFFTKGMKKIKDFGNWFLSYIPPKPKVVDNVLESFKNKN